MDSTGIGDAILDGIQAHPDKQNVKSEDEVETSPQATDWYVNAGANFEGFIFSGPSKQQLMEELAVSIQQGEISYPDNEIKSELDSYEYEYVGRRVRYSAPEGMYDDCVCALALANRMLGGGSPEADIF